MALALEHRALGAAERRERVAAALALTGLAEFATAYPKQLSGGMRQRVGIARALVVRPAVLLLDEPLSALDAQTRELLMEDLLAIWAREKSTRVYVTHNLEEAARLADRVVVLSRRPGRIRDDHRASTCRWPSAAARARRPAARGPSQAVVADPRRGRHRRPRDAAVSEPSADRRPIPFRGGGFDPVPRRLLPWLVFFVLIALWQAASSAGLLPPLSCRARPPSCDALGDLWPTARSARTLGASLGRLIPGWIIGTAAGLAAGLAMGIFSAARAAGLPIVSALFPIPKIALLPLLILWFGIGEPSKIATIALGVFFPTVISAYSACDSVPRNLIRMGQSFGLPATDIVAKILLPGAMPGILAGFRISASVALLLLVAAEMIGAQYGIGAFVLTAGNLMQTDQLWPAWSCCRSWAC